jgi:adenylate cyclase
MKFTHSMQSLSVGIIVLALSFFVRNSDPPITAALRGSGFDTLQSFWPRTNDNPQPVRIIDIDEASLKSIGQWPWPRNVVADLVTKLKDLGASAIVFDIVFAEPDRLSPSAMAAVFKNIPTQDLPDNDKLLSQAIADAPVVNVFASTAGPQSAPPMQKSGFAQSGLPALEAPLHLAKITTNLPLLNERAAGLGSMNIDLAGDQGIARQIPLIWTDGKTFYPSLVLEALRVAQGADTYIVNASAETENQIDSIRVGDIEIPTSETGMLQVNYRKDDPALYVSAEKLLNSNDLEAFQSSIENHIVLIGTSAVGLLDTRTSALGEPIPGVSVHAQALEQILSGAFLSRPTWIVAIEYLITGLFGILVSVLAMSLRPINTLASMAAVLALLASLTVVTFRHYGLLFDFTFPATTLVLTFLSTIAYKLLVTDREGRQMRRVFGHYVAPTVMAEIERNPQNLKLGGEIREVTVMFVDIQDFTPLSEKLPPQELVKIINGALEACSQAILSEGGTIDKYIGDAVMAFWNAPLATPEHQYHAAKAALKINQQLASFNQQTHVKQTLEDIGTWPISVRIGMASGPAVVGNMGSLNRFDYSALGEAVNTAARAETACKVVGHNIVLAGDVTPKTACLALLAASAIPMKGKSRNTNVYAIMGDETLANTADFQKFKLRFEPAINEKNPKVRKSLLKEFPEYEALISAAIARHMSAKVDSLSG